MKERTKIIHIITRMDKGGSAQNTLLTCLALSERYEIILVYGLSLESQMTAWERQSIDSTIKEAERKGVKHINIPSLVRRIDPARDLSAFFSLWRLVLRERPAIVHTHTSKAGILGRCAAKLAGVPTIVHTPHGHVFYGHFRPFSSRFFLLVEKILALITDRMIALTESEREDYIASAVSHSKKIITIHSGVEVDHYMNAKVNVEEKRRTLGLDPKVLVVGTVGWLLPIKGPMYLLRAMERVWLSHPEIQLVFVGKGDLESELRKKASQIWVTKRVKFLGWRDDIPEIMNILDVFVLPSLNEGMGRVLIEAMAAGKPIIASNVGGIPDLVIQGENGLLVPEKDIKALAEGIEYLLENQRERIEMGEKGRKMATNYGVNSMVEKIDRLYLELLGR
jgi:glycosyltransferase involved in cell wall biosynthesis